MPLAKINVAKHISSDICARLLLSLKHKHRSIGAREKDHESQSVSACSSCLTRFLPKLARSDLIAYVVSPKRRLAAPIAIIRSYRRRSNVRVRVIHSSVFSGFRTSEPVPSGSLKRKSCLTHISNPGRFIPAAVRSFSGLVNGR